MNDADGIVWVTAIDGIDLLFVFAVFSIENPFESPFERWTRLILLNSAGFSSLA